jgi:hypothetical protein
MMSCDDADEILKMVKEDQMSWEEGYELIEEQKQNCKTDVSKEKGTGEEKLFFKKIWKETPIDNSRKKEQLTGSILLFAREDYLGEEMRKKVDSNQVILVKPGEEYHNLGSQKYIINPCRQEDYKKLAEELKKQDIQFKKAIHTWSKDDYDLELLEKDLEKEIYSFFYLSKMIMNYKPDDKVELLYVYPSFEDNIQPHHAAVSGLARTVTLENKKIIAKILKVQAAGKREFEDFLISDKFLFEELHVFEDSEVCYRGEQRFVKTLKEFNSIPQKQNKLKKNRTYLITGGTGALGFIFAKYLAKEYEANLILSGRSKLNQEKRIKLSK